MPDQNDTTNTTTTTPATDFGAGAPAPIIPNDAVAASASIAADAVSDAPTQPVNDPGIIADVAAKIGESHNILVALSSDPSVDELCSAIGLSLYLDRLGKRVAAIYSGSTPNALEFLKPEETFEQSADTLQDFVIALNKEKADHLRYKLDGDYVKIFITPYRSRIASDDLEFSYGDYNVDLVLALDVANGVDLDAALREHGRIMHDASVINITTGNPGKLGEIEWSDKSASSVSEMIAELLYNTGGQNKMEVEEATAFLTGIVAATNRFATAGTTARTMEIASRLMESGANQQLISKNITPDMENEFFSPLTTSEKSADDPTKLDIAHGESQEGEDGSGVEASIADGGNAETMMSAAIEENKEVEPLTAEKENTLLDDLKAAEASLAASVSGVVTPEVKEEPLKLTENPSIEDSLKDLANFDVSSAEPGVNIEPSVGPATTDEHELMRTAPEKVIEPLDDFAPEPLGEGTNKYGQMLEDALAEKNESVMNPATSNTPAVATTPEINGVPEINYMPMPGDETLPPPPTPPIDFGGLESAEPIIPGYENPVELMPTDASIPQVQEPSPALPVVDSSPVQTEPAVSSTPVAEPAVVPTIEPVVEPTTSAAPELSTAPVVAEPQASGLASDPAAFKIPGM